MSGVILVGGVCRTYPVPRAKGFLAGTTSVSGAPEELVRRRVQLVVAAGNAHGHILPAIGRATWTWADVAGTWRFDNLDPALKYHVIAYDHTGAHDPVIKMNLTPSVD